MSDTLLPPLSCYLLEGEHNMSPLFGLGLFFYETTKRVSCECILNIAKVNLQMQDPFWKTKHSY